MGCYYSRFQDEDDPPAAPNRATKHSHTSKSTEDAQSKTNECPSVLEVSSVCENRPREGSRSIKPLKKPTVSRKVHSSLSGFLPLNSAYDPMDILDKSEINEQAKPYIYPDVPPPPVLHA